MMTLERVFGVSHQLVSRFDLARRTKVHGREKSQNALR
jgi:hypothetical protein